MRESTGRKTIRKDKLSVDEIDKIIVTYKTEKLTQREIAVKFGVSARLVSSLVVSERKNPDFLSSLRKREKKRREKLRAVINESIRQLKSQTGLIRAADVVSKLGTDDKVNVSLEYVRKVLRNDIGAKYAKIKKIPYLGNSDRCLLLR